MHEIKEKLEPLTEMETDPFVGSQETTDSPYEASHTPDKEMALEQSPFGGAVKSRTVAGLLGIFLGGLGAHRFYLGYWRVGIIQLILTLGAFLVGSTVAMLTGATVLGAFGIGAGAAALGIIWGWMEGSAIFVGGLTHDAMWRPLRG